MGQPLCPVWLLTDGRDRTASVGCVSVSITAPVMDRRAASAATLSRHIGHVKTLDSMAVLNAGASASGAAVW